MGARVFFNIKQDENTYISLYSHWGEYTRFSDLANALDKARPRWGDVSYATRIIISQLIGTEWDSEIGYGLFAGTEPLIDESNLEVDITNKTVTDETGTHDFDTFINFHGIVRTI